MKEKDQKFCAESQFNQKQDNRLSYNFITLYRN